MPDIDIVYTWVNSRDEIWRQKYDRYYPYSAEGKSFEKCRFNDNDELKYALRSLEKYAPWINRVFIITDNQQPAWLNTKHPKISIIDHKDIIPHDKLPTFNSNAIEMCMSNIPNLSEYFLYGNDDTYFGSPVSPDFFYDNDKIICRFIGKINELKNSQYRNTLINSVRCLQNHNYKCLGLMPHHNIDAYKKSVILKAIKEFNSEVQETLNHKYRTDYDIEKNIFALYAIAIGQGIRKDVYLCRNKTPVPIKVVKKLFKGSYNDSVFYQYNTPNIEEKLNRYSPRLFCINDNETTSDEDRKKIKSLLAKMFPDKSSYEL